MSSRLLVFKNLKEVVHQTTSQFVIKTSILAYAKSKLSHPLGFWILNIEVSLQFSYLSILFSAPHDIGPGSYIHEKGDINFGFEKFKKPTAPVANVWAKSSDKRFKDHPEKIMIPGPGEYKDYSKWNKRTYNLKFLNNQTQAQTSNQGAAKATSPQNEQSGQIQFR